MLNILVVDDSMPMRRIVRVALEQLGYNVVGEASSGKESLEKYKMLRPDLVTMDIAMPNMNGIDAVKELKKINSDVKVIMITSIGEEAKVMDAIIAGAKGYVLKPIDRKKITESIKKIFPLDDTEVKEM
jgi:two-component system chemotaxis response regulator CheY